MKDPTKKLAGAAKDRYFHRFFSEDPGVDAVTADRLTARSAEVFSSVRIRPGVTLRPPAAAVKAAAGSPMPPADAAEVAPLAASDSSTAPEATSDPSPVADPTAVPDATAAADEPRPAPVEPPHPDTHPAVDPEHFDPFAFGLVPVFKREGAEGLFVKLAGVASTDHLKAMAKAQQIVLPREVRQSDIDLVTLRAAIVEAVEKRVSDRKATL